MLLGERTREVAEAEGCGDLGKRKAQCISTMAQRSGGGGGERVFRGISLGGVQENPYSWGEAGAGLGR